jgi:CBS domain-containing protein
MASNPEWCLSLDEWKDKFAGWIDRGDPDALLNATIFFDFRFLYGKHQLAQALRDWLVPMVSANPRFLRQLAANALCNKPPLGFVRDFVVGEGNMLDLKLTGATPFVDAARILGFAAGVSNTSTVQRLQLAAAKLNIAPAETDAWIEALHFIQLLRLRRQHEKSLHGEAMDDSIDPDTLNDLDRRILKEAFRQARKLQNRLALDYKL